MCWPRVSPALTAEAIWGWRRCLSLHLPPPFQMHWARSKECPKCVEQFGLCPSLSTRVVRPPQVAAAPFTQGPNPRRQFSLKAGKKPQDQNWLCKQNHPATSFLFPQQFCKRKFSLALAGEAWTAKSGQITSTSLLLHQLLCFFLPNVTHQKLKH